MLNNIVQYFLVGVIVLVLIAIINSEYKNHNSTSVEIKKDNWQCTKTENKTNLQLIGKVLVPQVKSECIEYTKSVGNNAAK